MVGNILYVVGGCNAEASPLSDVNLLRVSPPRSPTTMQVWPASAF